MWLLVFGSLFASAGTAQGASCQLDLSPRQVVVEYGGSISANCSSPPSQTKGMGWESPISGVGYTEVSFLTLKIDKVNLWTFKTMCYNSLINGSQCTQELPVTVYKMPDSVSMSMVDPVNTLKEGASYRFQCDVTNVAPAQNLTVIWRKANKMHTEAFKEPSLSPVNKSSLYFIKAQREDNRAQIWCEAKLNVMPSGGNLPTMRSEAHVMNVLYPPTFNRPENESLVIPADRKKIQLNCTATGNPTPIYRWSFPQPVEQMDQFKNDEKLTLNQSLQFPGTYACTSTNNLGSETKYFTLVEAPRNRSTLAAIVGVFVFLAVVLIIAGLFTVTPGGTFSLSKGSYLRGQRAPSGPV